MVLYIIFALIVLGVARVSYEIGKHTKNQSQLFDLEIELVALRKVIEGLKYKDFKYTYREPYRDYIIDVSWRKSTGFYVYSYNPESDAMGAHVAFTGMDKDDLIAKCKRHIDGLKTMEK
jgi:hypothetical protein